MFSSIKEADDLSPFKGIEDQLRSPVGQPPEGDAVLRTLDMLPPRFAAYAKVFHPIYEDPARAKQDTTWDEADKASGEVEEPPVLKELLEDATLVRTGVGGTPPRGWRRVLWSELADRFGLPFQSRLSEKDLDSAWRGRSWPARLIGPDEGDLTPGVLKSMISAIRKEGDQGACYFWWSFIACINVFDPDDIRDYLFGGRLRDLPRFLAKRGATSPTYWWPENRAWCVATDWDLCFSVMGGSKALIARVLAAPAIEGLTLGPEDTLLTYTKRSEGSA